MAICPVPAGWRQESMKKTKILSAPASIERLMWKNSEVATATSMFHGNGMMARSNMPTFRNEDPRKKWDSDCLSRVLLCAKRSRTGANFYIG